MSRSQVSKAACILTTQHLMRTLRSKEAAASVNIKTWPTIIDTGMTATKKKAVLSYFGHVTEFAFKQEVRNFLTALIIALQRRHKLVV